VTRVLLIKTSSLGDVIHCLPAVSDMARCVPDLTLDWMIEESLAEIARLHPAVTRIIPTRLRRWRRNLFSPETHRGFGEMRRAISAAPYERVIDAQGLIRSAIISRLAAGPSCGYDRHSVREPPASLFYNRKYRVSVTIHAAERMRRLAAQALGYHPPAEIDYGIRVEPAQLAAIGTPRYLVGLHATARPDKLWAEERWIALARLAAQWGLPLVLPWGDEGERDRAGRIAANSPGVIVPPRLGFTEMAGLLAGAAAVVGVDTGLTHLASAVGAPVVAIYSASWSEFNGVIGPGFIANLGGPGAPPDVEVVWEQVQEAVRASRVAGPWRPAPDAPPPDLANRRRFRPSNARAVVHRR